MISADERESLRHHLGLGNIGVDAAPYSNDDHQALIELLVANLTTAPETTSASSITPGVAIVTPAAMTGIVPYCKLLVDVADDAEIVTVQSVTATTFSARFQRAHAAGVPVAIWSGTARLRTLLHRADQAWAACQDPSVGSTAGIRSIDKGDIVFADRSAVIRDRLRHYREIVSQIGSLVRFTPRTSACSISSNY